MAGLSASERPEKRAKREIARLDAEPLDRLVAAADSERWRAAFGLAAYAGLRLGEVRALRWQDIDLEASAVTVRRSLLPDGTDKTTKTAAGLDGLDERLSMHSLRHSFASMLATNLELPPTTLAQLIGHADAGFTLRVYARDTRDTRPSSPTFSTAPPAREWGSDLG